MMIGYIILWCLLFSAVELISRSILMVATALSSIEAEHTDRQSIDVLSVATNSGTMRCFLTRRQQSSLLDKSTTAVPVAAMCALLQDVLQRDTMQLDSIGIVQ